MRERRCTRSLKGEEPTLLHLVWCYSCQLSCSGMERGMVGTFVAYCCEHLWHPWITRGPITHLSLDCYEQWLRQAGDESNHWRRLHVVQGSRDLLPIPTQACIVLYFISVIRSGHEAWLEIPLSRVRGDPAEMVFIMNKTGPDRGGRDWRYQNFWLTSLRHHHRAKPNRPRLPCTRCWLLHWFHRASIPL